VDSHIIGATAHADPPNCVGEDDRSIPTDIPCLRCGVCCSRYVIHVAWLEAHRIADGLGIIWDEFEQTYLEPHWPDSSYYLLRKLEGKCIFLIKGEGSDTGKASCYIHPFRPDACREWTPSLYRHPCQEELTRRWGLAINAKEQIEGPAESLREFHVALALLGTD